MTAQKQEKSNKTGCLDTFALFTGVIGLMVDGIALTSLLFAVVNITGNEATIETNNLPTFAVLILFALILIYSWLTLSWYFSRRYFNNTKKSPSDKIPSIVLATGLLIIPIWWMWIFFLFLNTDPTINTINIGWTLLGIVIPGTIGIGFFGAFIGSAIVGVISILSPVIYTDMSEILNE